MGFKMKSESGKDMSFVMYIEDTENGKEGRLRSEYPQGIAHGEFCDPEDAELCTRLVYKELKRLRDTRMTSSQLAAAKKQLIGQIGVASDNNENNALGMAKTFLHYNKYETAEAVFRRIGQLTPEILLEVANEMFAEDYLSTLVYD